MVNQWAIVRWHRSIDCVGALEDLYSLLVPTFVRFLAQVGEEKKRASGAVVIVEVRENRHLPCPSGERHAYRGTLS